MKPKYSKLEDSQVWNNIFEISKQVQGEYETLHDDDKFPYEYDLKNEAISCVKYAAEAAGSLDPRDRAWQLGLARSKLFAVKSTLKLIYGYKLLDVNPELMVLIDSTVKLIDTETKELPAQLKDWQKTFDMPARKKP